MLVVRFESMAFLPYAHSSTPDGLDMAYRKGLALKMWNLCNFIQVGFCHLGS